jgi:hypothetical protein
MKKISAVEWLVAQLTYSAENNRFIDDGCDDVTDIVNEARQMEINIAQNYAEFCVLCHINNLPFLDFKSYIEKVEA